MKYLKQKLMAAVAMLAVSAVMLTSASYAWFTISVTPEVKTVTTKISANENFEIAWGTDDKTTPDAYFAALANGDATDTSSNDNTWGATIKSIPELTGLGPAKLDTTIKTVEYGEDGRPDGLKAALRTLSGDNQTTIANGIAEIKDFDGNVIGQTILVWLRTNVEGNVSVDVSEVKMAVAENDDRAHLVKTAFEVCTFSSNKVVASGNIVEAADTNAADNKDIRTASLGKFAANTAIPVLIHVYLDGDAVTNADVADDYLVTLGSIKFTNDQIDGKDSYLHNELNASKN